MVLRYSYVSNACFTSLFFSLNMPQQNLTILFLSENPAVSLRCRWGWVGDTAASSLLFRHANLQQYSSTVYTPAPFLAQHNHGGFNGLSCLICVHGWSRAGPPPSARRKPRPQRQHRAVLLPATERRVSPKTVFVGGERVNQE